MSRTAPLPHRSYRGRVLTTVPQAAGSPALLRFEEDGVVVVDAAGDIVSVEPCSRAAPRPLLDLHPWVITPGFADAHLHLPQTRVIGSATGPLLDWLDQTVFPEELRFTDEPYAALVASEFHARLLAAGTTCAGIYATSSPVAARVAFEHAERAGILAQIGLVLMDRGAPPGLLVPPDRALADLAALLARWGAHERLRLAVTPRFALSCTPELLQKSAEFAADRSLFVQTHLSENEGEGAATLAAFPGAGDYLGAYEAAGLVHERTLFAHAIHLSESEWERLARSRARLVHCPDSNLFLGSGRMRLRQALRRGLRVGLGSDVAAGRTFDMRRIAASAYDTALVEREPVSPQGFFGLATWGGANVLGFGARTGALTPGRRADLAVLDLPAHVRAPADVLGQVLFASDSVRVRHTFVGGRRVHSA